MNEENRFELINALETLIDNLRADKIAVFCGTFMDKTDGNKVYRLSIGNPILTLGCLETLKEHIHTQSRMFHMEHNLERN